MKPISTHLSLQNCTLFKIVITLWNQNDVRTAIQNYPLLEYDRHKCQWRQIELIVLKKVPHLPIPGCLTEKICGLIKAIGLEILKWVNYHLRDHLREFRLGLHLPSEFVLTPLGFIDRQKTAEVFIKDETVPIETKYRLACMYCLENYVKKLWNELLEDSMHNLYSQGCSDQGYEYMCVKYFTHAVKGELNKMIYRIHNSRPRLPLTVCMLRKAALEGNAVATVYFLNKLTPEQKEMYLVEIANDASSDCDFPSNGVDVLCILLSQMDQEKQISVLNQDNFKLLINILDWPWQNFFIETVTPMCNFIYQEIYEKLLKKIFLKIIKGNKGLGYEGLFSELWMIIPHDIKNRILQECFNENHLCSSNLLAHFTSNLLFNFCQIKEIKTIKLILRDAKPRWKKDFLFKIKGHCICCALIEHGEWDLLEFFIRDIILSKKELLRLKNSFVDSVTLFSVNQENRSKFFCLLDELICSAYDKSK